MAVDLGKIAVTPKGNYNSGVPYEKLDLVTLSGNSYLSRINNNNQPLSNNTAWQVIAQKGVDGINGTNAQSFNSKGNVANYETLPSTGNVINDAYYNLEDNLLYVYNGTSFPTEGNGISLKGSNGTSEIPTWVPQAYLENALVQNNGLYQALEDTLSTDIPGISLKWKSIISVDTTTGKNLFDKETMVFDGLIQLNGIVYPTGFKYAKIPVKELQTYKVSEKPLLVWFLIQDANGNNIPNPTPGEGGNYSWNMTEFLEGTFTTPDDAAFFLLNVTHPTAPEEGVNLNTFQVEKGILSTIYEPYKIYLDSVNGAKVKDNTTVVIPGNGKNLFDKNTMIFDGLISINVIQPVAGFKHAKIPIESLQKYKINQVPIIDWFLVQDENGNNIPNPTSGENGNYKWSMEEFLGGRFTGVSNAKFLLINVTHPSAPEEGVDIDTFQVEKGDFSTEYEPYKLYLKSVDGYEVYNDIQIPNENYIDSDVVLLGDSITAAVGVIGWVDQLLKNISFKSIKRYARSGATWTNFGGTNDNPLDLANSANNTISHQFQRVIKDYDDGLIATPKTIIILAGVNDARDMGLGTIAGAFPSYNTSILNIPVGEINTLTQAIRFNTERIWQKFPDCQVIISTPLQSGNDNLPRVKEVRDLVIECGLRLGIQVIDQYGESGIYGFNEIGTNHKYLSDNLHPNEEGAKKVALFLMQQFKEKIIKNF